MASDRTAASRPVSGRTAQVAAEAFRSEWDRIGRVPDARAAASWQVVHRARGAASW
ncbi:hypothetical protein GCM10023319_77410 [Nocardia iowensis]